MAIRVLADGHIKLSLLTTKPSNPAAPTVTELNAGIDISCKVLQDGFTFGPTDSDKVQEKALCSTTNANTQAASNGEAAFTMWRFFATTGGGFDSTDDAPFVAVKTKGTTIWLYGRQTDKLATETWAASDEIFYGCETVTDRPQRSDAGGFIKYRVPTDVQNDWAFITAATGA